MRFYIDDGVLIEGTAKELTDLAGDIDHAIAEGVAESKLLTADGVLDFVVRRVEAAE